MLPLPILDVHLQPCSENWQQMTHTAQGRHCASCQRTVFDFTDKTSADLEAARAASPDGRLCGRFRAAQLAHPPRLRPRLRRFLVALVLVCGLGLTSQEAWAQVRQETRVHSAQRKPAVHSKKQPLRSVTNKDSPIPITEIESTFLTGGIGPERFSQGDIIQAIDSINYNTIWTYAERMPAFSGGHDAMQAFLQKNILWPKDVGMVDVEGRVFVNFIVGKEGRLREFKVLKGLHPLFDAEALRVARLLNGRFTPGIQDGRPVDVYYTVAVTFGIK